MPAVHCPIAAIFCSCCVSSRSCLLHVLGVDAIDPDVPIRREDLRLRKAAHQFHSEADKLRPSTNQAEHDLRNVLDERAKVPFAGFEAVFEGIHDINDRI
jgi:hypothetical protein